MSIGFGAHLTLETNKLEQRRRAIASSSGYLDLTSSSAVQQGFRFPPHILQAATQKYFETRNYQPHAKGDLKARQSICRYYQSRSANTSLTSDHFFLTASTSESYSHLFSLLAEPGDNFLCPDVTYPLFEFLADYHRIELRPYRLDPKSQWDIDPTTILDASDERTRGVLVVSPNNPTGKILSRPLQILNDLGLPLICDEVFASFTYKMRRTPLLSDLHPNLPVFLLNGISKMFALPDLKLGWMALNQPALELYGDRLELLNDTFLSCNALTQSLIPDIFEKGRSFLTQFHEDIRSRMSLALNLLQQCPRVHVIEPDGGIYLFPQIEGVNDDEEFALRLLDSGVLVHPGYFYGVTDKVHIMISCLTNPDVLKQGISILKNVLLS